MKPSPLILNFGGGVDSTAIGVGLVRLHRKGELYHGRSARPDLVIFADTGGEMPETYAHIELFSAWLVENGFPSVTVVSRSSEIKRKATTHYTTLEGNCLSNETLPSEAFNLGSCSCKWKHEPMDRFLHGYKRPKKPGWLERNDFGKPIKLIGYDATETKSGKRAKWAKVSDDGVAFLKFPLVEWGWSREDCIREIAAEGLPVPMKSACFFCPNQKPCELRYMADKHPELFLRALRIEEVARRGRHGLRKVDGLWSRDRAKEGTESWTKWAKREGLLSDAEARAGFTLESLICHVDQDEWLEGRDGEVQERKIGGLWGRDRAKQGTESWNTWARREGLLGAAEEATGTTLEDMIAEEKPDLHAAG